MLSKSIAFSVLMCCSTVTFAKFYQCNQDGKMVFSDRQCEGEQKELTIRTNKAATNKEGTTLQRQQKYLEAQADERAFNNKQAEADKKIADKLAEQCKKMRANLTVYKGSGLVYEEVKGKRVYITDKQRATDTEKLEKEVAQKCKK
ncbi:MAG: hypothetical protein HN790_05035 [Methylococcales bacterium]|jgi:hypothetical protein|nr:hypothetical protein [Methylococcales bacterium]